MKFYQSHGVHYMQDDFGIHQVNPQPYKYDENYVATYDSPEYVKGNDILQAMRLAFVIGAHGSVPASILDNGYGNGAFMKHAKKLIEKVMGVDVTGVEVEGCIVTNMMEEASVYTFWDCLEHIVDLSFLQDLPCETVAVSLPWCHEEPGSYFFDYQYKHRKPDEHVHHFNPSTLKNLFSYYGWEEVAWSTHEDLVRVSTHGRPNILTMAFKRV